MSLNLNAQLPRARSQEELERRMDPGKEVRELLTEVGKGGRNPLRESPQKEYSSNYDHRVVLKVDKSEYRETKQNIKGFALLNLGEAYRRGCERIIITVKTGGFFGSHRFSFYVNDLLSEKQQQR